MSISENPGADPSSLPSNPNPAGAAPAITPAAVNAAASAAASEATAPLAIAIRSIKLVVNITLLALMVLGGSLLIFLLRESTALQRQVTEGQRVISNYRENAEPRMEDFFAKLRIFAKSNPDFAPVLAKYFRSTNAPAATASPDPVIPAPAAELPAARPPGSGAR